MSAASEQREVFYRGRVQGVGFRYTVRSLAARRRVTGFVRNMPDGRVQLVAEGEPAEVQGLLADVRDEMRRYISGVEEFAREPTGQFRDFVITH